MKKISLSLIAAMGIFLFASCGSDTTQQDTTETEFHDEDDAVQAEPITIELEAGDDMKYNKDILEARPGQKVTLILKHTGKLPKEQMGHNFVLLKEGTDINEFGQLAAQEAANDHIPASEMDNIIVHSDMIGGGETTQIEFVAPEAGNYPFICSFPGHFGTMRGTFIVE